MKLMQQKTKKTSRKFYGKWLYKVSLEAAGAAMFRIRTLENLIEFCNANQLDDRPYSLVNRAWHNRETLLKLALFLSTYDVKTWTKRIEQNTIDFYSNDPQFYEQLSNQFEELLTHRFEPDEGSLDLLEQPQTILAKKLPHNRYQYKAYLLPHKLANDREGKHKYIEWLKTQTPRITCTPAVEQWFIKTEWNWDRRYVLVEDEHTLLMLKLRNAEVIGRVYNYVIAINN